MNIETPITMTLDIGSPFKVTAKPYIIAANNQMPLVDASKHLIITLIIVALIVGIGVLSRRGKCNG